MHCTYCKRPIDPRPGYHHQRTIGWERKAVAAARRSGSDIVLRERLNEFACNGCVEERKLGSAGQGVLNLT